jgi:hypothetical protein
MRTTLILAAILAGSSVASAQGPVTLDAKSKTELLATRELAWRAWFGGDRAALEAMLPPEFIGIGWGEGPWSDKAASLAGSEEFARGGGKLTRLEFPRTEIQAYGDVAFVYSTYVVEFTAGGQQVLQEGRATEVFVRRGGKWLHPGWHLDSGK